MSRAFRFGSVCSGIEAASVAWNPIGWETAFMSEIAAFPRAVLKHHYTGTPLHGDFTTIGGTEYGPIDLLAGGTPCQSFSIAGLRNGLDDDRGNLTLEYLRLAERTGSRWLVWENVVGVLSSNGGRDFGSILGALCELGYGWAYRVLDAQFIRVDGYTRAVPQRRRRVVLVGYLGDWRRAAAVLFERSCLQGHSPPRRKARQDVAPTLSARTQGGGGLGTDAELDGGLIPEVAGTIQAGGDRTRVGDTLQCAVQGHMVPEVARTVTTGEHQRQDFETTTMVPVAFGSKDHGADALEGISPTLRAGTHDKSHANSGVPPAVTEGLRVRRLTPRECERLMGFPDDYTRIPYRRRSAEQCPDGPRYKAIGNSWAVNVFRWVGRRIDQVETLGVSQ